MHSVRILGVPVSAIDMTAAVDTVLLWASRGESQFVCVRDCPSIVNSVEDPDLMAIQRSAGMVTPDGLPLSLIGRFRGYRSMRRVAGADLVDALCAATSGKDLSHYFFGGKTGVAAQMIDNLQRKYPGLRVAGHYSPPFRSLTEEEDAELVATIQQSNAKIVWVGLSSPKQEFWMRDHVGRIAGATLIGVGAAFDFHSGAVQRAPGWMQRSGLEWFHRLLSEPRRLWHRYLVRMPKFVALVLKEQLTGSYRV